MTSRNPPPPGGPPRLDAYRPSEERPGPPQRPGPQTRGPHAQPYPQHTQPQPPHAPPHPQQAYDAYAAPPPGPPPHRGHLSPGAHFPPGAHLPPGGPIPPGGPLPPGAPRPLARPAAPRRTPPPAQRTSIATMLLYAVLGLMAMAAGALAFTLFALPAGFVRDRIVTAVKEQTGRDLVIAGPASFTVFPSLGLSLEDVSLSAGPGFEDAAPLVKMRSLDVSVALWPLLQREVRVDSLRLSEPVFTLEVDDDGRRSWDFASAAKPAARVRLAHADTLAQAPMSDADPAFAADEGDASGESFLRLGDLALDDVRIDNGSLTYRNALSGGVTELSAINVNLGLDALTAPLLADGSVDVKGRTIRFDGTLTSLAELVANQPAKVKVALAADALDATYEGSATFHDALLTEGILSANSSSARDLFQWFGTELPPSKGFGKLSAKGLLRGSREQFTYSNAEIVLDQTTAHGEISLDTRGMRPLVKANLKLSELDLNTYSSKGEKRRATARKKKDSARSIDDLLDGTEAAPPGPRVKGYTERAGWSSEPFDFEGLGQIDADATLSIGRLTVSTIRLDQSDLKVLLKNRVMTTTLEEVRLYGGTGRGTVILDGSGGSTARLGADLKMEDIEALPLLTDAADVDRLTGKGRLVVVLTGDGASEREVVETLAGRIEFAFEDGAILGVNVAEMLRNLSRGNLRGLDAKPSDKTDFSTLTSSWTVTSGVAENQDLKLMSPLIRLTGSGRAMLPEREVDYTLKPRLVASLSGQGGENDLSGLEIPVRVQGSWDDPKFAPDLSGLAKDPDQAIGAIRELGKQFKGKNANEIVDDLLGSDGEARGNARETGKKLLDQFLGGR